MPSHPSTLQDIILKLQRYWADQGCLIWQPYHTEVGAGTMNPATFLRALGPEPWWVAYVEPSFRPADGRYGENPNRWQHYYQFQVILKPDPGDPQERYLESLLALGIDPDLHDIRFVEDNWEAPTIGAWGLGWEVWLDGQEITQFTYFQQAGGQTVEPVSVEITYGLERIALALQGADSFLDLEWDGKVTYGEAKLRSEVEYCIYNFELADVEHLNQLYEIYEAEAERALERGLVQPAHDFVLKCSHVFNLLDARGAVGVTERAAFFGRMRELARDVAVGYEEQRAEADHPWMGRWTAPPLEEPETEADEALSEPAPFLLEIGTEELPAADLSSALEQLEEAAPRMLQELRLEHDGVHVLGTPRRLVIEVDGLAPRQREDVTTVKGPPAERAYDSDGEPTQAAIGFARGKGVEVDELQVEELDGGRYVVAEMRQPGRPAAVVLVEALPEMLGDLTFGRSMRWNASGVPFSRPVRWILALHGETVVPFAFAGVAAGRSTRGMRFEDPESFPVGSADEYRAAIDDRGIVLDFEGRRREIQRQVSELAEEVGGQIVDDPDLLDEVTGLVEVPTAIRGRYDERYLDLPRPVLISVMRKHQRYFALEADGELLPYFITVRNGGATGADTVREGNEQVIRARFADATYFVEKDLETGLENYLPRLETLTFESSLGSMREKVERVEQLVGDLADAFDLDEEQRAAALRAAHLSKADLASEMVVEMTSLQGEMGRIYALHAGEPEQVAVAIAEHYLPRYSGDRVPESEVGIALGVADRLDSLMGLFAAGMEPSGAGDPFALRRTAIGLVETLVAHDRSFDLRRGLDLAAERLPVEVTEEHITNCLAFIRQRQRGLLLAEGHRHDVVEAVLAEQGQDPANAHAAVDALETWMERDEWPELLENYARCARITRDVEADLPLDPESFEEPAAVELLEAYREADSTARERGSVDDFMRAFTPLVPPIRDFFDEVLVMAEDEATRRNRLALLQRIVTLADGVLDMSHLEGF